MKREFYTAEWCGGCKQKKVYLHNKGLTDFELIDVGDDPAAYGIRSLPHFKLDDNPASWDQFLASFN